MKKSEPESGKLSEGEELIRRLAEPEQLQHADRLATVGRLAAGIIHELGTPLNVVGSYAQMIATGEVTGEDVIQPARAIEEQVKRMSRIIRLLLNFARRNVERYETVEILALAQQTVGVLTVFAKRTGAILTVESDEEGPLIVDGSPGLLQQVLVNLVTNAIHAMPNGGRITIEVDRISRPERNDDGGPVRPWIRIAVKDEGVGIPQEDQPRIFEPFYTTKEAGRGTGLGLAVCTDLVRDHGGWMELDATGEQGTRFCVVLPERRLDLPEG
ncbi:MAG: HAMP domain-containing sensor histidine kinase [bacterium]